MFTRSLPWIAVVLTGLTACAHPPAGTPPPDTALAAPMSSHNDVDTLQAYDWQLTHALDAQGNTQSGWLETGHDQAVQLGFGPDRLSVSGLCNAIGAHYQVQDANRMQVSRPVGTLKMCNNDALMRYEQQFALRLPQIHTWSIQPHPQQPTLVLGFKDGAQWQWQGTPTPETRYGGPADTLFLEVAPDTVACPHPLIANHRCLRTRQITYNQAGIKQSTGEWGLFYDGIQGYQHQPGTRHVLRVKRYTRQSVPADASRYVYILDLVVETDTTPDAHPRPSS